MRPIGTRFKMTNQDRHGKLHTFYGTIRKQYRTRREYGIEWDNQTVCTTLPSGAFGTPRYGITIIKG